MEKINRMAARFVNDYNQLSSVTAMLDKLNCPSLEHRRKKQLMFKIVRGLIMIMTSGWGLQQRPITKKYSTLKIKIDNEAVQKLHTS